MGVLIEGMNVVIRNATVNTRYPGGVEEYARHCPNATFCTDGDLCRVGFMSAHDASSFVRHLERFGFALSTQEGSPEIAVINEVAGVEFPCSWLDLGHVELGSGQSAAVAWIRGTTLSTLVAPPAWKPGQVRTFTADMLSECDFLGTSEGVDTFRDRKTGELRYVGRTGSADVASHLSRSAIKERTRALWDELSRLGALDDIPASDYRGDVTALHGRARQLVADTGGVDAMPLQIQGIAARLLEQWEEAALLFHRVADLRPDWPGGWLELTWALASLRRFEEAEQAARRAVELDPQGAATLSNLAATLFQQGKLGQARDVAERAVSLHPAEVRLKELPARIQRASR